MYPLQVISLRFTKPFLLLWAAVVSLWSKSMGQRLYASSSGDWNLLWARWFYLSCTLGLILLAGRTDQPLGRSSRCRSRRIYPLVGGSILAHDDLWSPSPCSLITCGPHVMSVCWPIFWNAIRYPVFWYLFSIARRLPCNGVLSLVRNLLALCFGSNFP